MEAEGQRGSTNPSAMLASLLVKRAKLHEELRNIEKQVYEMETSYLQDPNQCDGRSDFGPGRSKGGGMLTNGQGKPKKGGRTGPRDAKRVRTEPDYDYEDDHDLTS